jgi:hypothetical protein
MRVSRSADLLWLAATVLFVGLWIWRSMAIALSPLFIQDDARQHVFWMQRLVDPSILRGDLYADYFASQAPYAYVEIYSLLLRFVDPIVASKLLPPVLGMSAAVLTFVLVRRLDAAPHTAFLVAVLDSWYLWQYDDIPTGSPRAFLMPLFVGLLLALVTVKRRIALGVVIMAALIYPSAAALMVVQSGLGLVWVKRWRISFSRDWRDWLTVVLMGLLAIVLLAPMAFGDSQFGPAVTGAQARTMAEFGPNGRNAFFDPNPYQFFVVSYRSGFDLRVTDALLGGVPIMYELAALALLLPVAGVFGGRAVWTRCAPIVSLATRVVLASMTLYVAAHLLLFKLYLPARFVAWTVPLAFALLAGLGLAIVLERLARLMVPTKPLVAAGAVSVLAAIGLAAYPAKYDGNFVIDDIPNVTAYLRTLPADTLIAGVPTDTDSVPALTGRPVLVNREYALAYHIGFYQVVRQRTLDLIDAYYSDSPARVAEFAAKYGVQIFLVDRRAFDPAVAADAWAGSFEPYTSLVMDRLQRRGRFALLDSVRRCSVVTQRDVSVVPASCFQPSH